MCRRRSGDLSSYSQNVFDNKGRGVTLILYKSPTDNTTSRAERYEAGAQPATRSRPMSENVCPVSLCARARRPRVHDSRRLAQPADNGACESVPSSQGLLAVANASAA
ncbi:jg16546 [Pararge aegeria aegeria]|uniref:Jg16546 protein n=1 Tax=Pararge aegeria aegeria TaxID=348720 RepID=A0A8S4SQU3_9NEOP|nr:jg16546 [Pararge aegeria aegeria]